MKTVYIITPIAALSYVSVGVKKATHLIDDCYALAGSDRVIRAQPSDVFSTQEEATAAGRRALAKIRDRIEEYLNDA